LWVKKKPYNDRLCLDDDTVGGEVELDISAGGGKEKKSRKATNESRLGENDLRYWIGARLSEVRWFQGSPGEMGVRIAGLR